jgi:hypothetical protein
VRIPTATVDELSNTHDSLFFRGSFFRQFGSAAMVVSKATYTGMYGGWIRNCHGSYIYILSTVQTQHRARFVCFLPTHTSFLWYFLMFWCFLDARRLVYEDAKVNMKRVIGLLVLSFRLVFNVAREEKNISDLVTRGVITKEEEGSVLRYMLIPVHVPSLLMNLNCK